MKQSEIIIDGRLVHYAQSGTGKTVVLLHGWADDLRTFTGITQELQKQFTVVAVDLPGFGKSQPPATAWNLTDYAYWLEAFLKKTECDPYAVIGHSNGGALAIHATALGVIRPKKLILLAASGVRSQASVRRFFIKVIAKAGKLLTFWLPRVVRQRLQTWLYGTVGSDMLASPHMKETFKLTVRQDVQDDAATLKLPVQLLYGDNDKATPAHEIGSRLHHLIPQSELVVIPRSGHFVHHDAKATVLTRIQEFLA